jgi:hypothetical protein
LDKNSVIVWFIVIVMVGSILGFASFFSKPPETTVPQPQPSVENPTSIKMSAEDVNGTVFEVLPFLHLVAQTNESDIMKLNKKVGEVKGIYRVNGRYSFSDSPEFASSLLYVADISFDDSRTNPLELAEAIQEKTAEDLNVVGVYGTALVLVPENLHFENKDLNMSLDYTLKEGLIQSIVSASTRKDDQIVLLIEASFAGNELVGGSLNGFETKNLETEPKSLFLEKELEIDSLEKHLFVSAEAFFSEFVSFNELKEDLAFIEGIEEVKVDGYDPGFKATLLITDPRIAVLKQDLNEFLLSQEVIDEFSFNETEQGLTVSLSLLKGFDSGSFLEDLNALLFDSNVSMDSIELNEPKGFYTVDLNTSSTDTQLISNKIRNLFEEKNISVLFLQQFGAVLIDSLTDPDTNKEFFFKEKKQRVLLNPGHKKGDKVLLEIKVIVSRDQILSFNAAEK